MAVPCVRLALLLCLMIPATVASPRSRSLRKSPAHASASRPTAFFEVDRPPRARGSSGRRCSTLLLSASFGSTFDKPPATAAYSPPSCLVKAGGRASAISLAVLEWRAACRGPQLDRIFGVWLAGAELLRGSTAAPPPNGIVWSVSKDVTRYASLLAAAGNSTFAVYLGNHVNATLTGVYHANVTLHLYLRRTPTTKPTPATAPADLIVPMSRALPLNGGLWFPIQSAADVASKSVALPSNTYRAVLELYFSSHQDDELWYKNQPGYQNGPFREVTARVDGVLAGSVCPFPVIYPGGIYPLLWRPIAPIGSFNLPTYDIELTPFLGKLLDGKAHEFAFAVTNAMDVWYIDANLHLWLDPRGTATTAGLVSYAAPPTNTTSSKSADPVDTHYHATADRLVSATGWVKSSYGNITTNATRTFALDYLLTFETLDLTILADTGVVATDGAGGVLYSAQTHGNFPLGWVYQQNSLTVTHGLEETTVAAGRWSSAPPYRSLRTTQSSLVEDEEGGGKSWGVRQTYRYNATDGCYFRNVTSSNYSVVSDHSNELCVKGAASAGVGTVTAALPAVNLP
ncbi:hypothetical protein CFC21_053295 [Triticum aestivum]|uniref:Peptide N-acetyl-beta-D-glucosaminyl asparaginase amidase A N-terminal domain-containing protein n=3 Tax=Triticum TaxID=4564 RepID=A0A9R0SG33_TRITD|nr:peptide-N4-(N-acetyl-beta-glucosaminyl)asparagine amidase A-like [Triticum aestivum]KAF7044009.1 hypothetical protein CFC21_053295 [Triticum aestivum]VAH94680.1 unnamed protein product [Triticum turgidum subsp. durum]